MFKKIKSVFLEQMTRGATPEKLAQSAVCGALIGIFPLLGFTTMLSAALAAIFKLNHVVVQSVNYILYPVQIIMIPVYVKVVSLIFDVGDVPIRPDLILEKFNEGPMLFVKKYGMVGLYAIVLWLVLSIVLYFIIYPIILKAIIKIKNRRATWNGRV